MVLIAATNSNMFENQDHHDLRCGDSLGKGFYDGEHYRLNYFTSIYLIFSYQLFGEVVEIELFLHHMSLLAEAGFINTCFTFF